MTIENNDVETDLLIRGLKDLKSEMGKIRNSNILEDDDDEDLTGIYTYLTNHMQSVNNLILKVKVSIA